MRNSSIYISALAMMGRGIFI